MSAAANRSVRPENVEFTVKVRWESIVGEKRTPFGDDRVSPML
jgi:hypothetical protein